MILINTGVPEYLLDADATAAPFTGEAKALPVAATYGTWTVTTPGAISVVLEASFDGTAWFTIDSSTAAGMRNFQTSATQIRARVISGGSNDVTVAVTMKRAFVSVLPSGSMGSLSITGNASADRYLAGVGTAALPAYSFTSAPTTGIYYASNRLRFSIGGVANSLTLSGTDATAPIFLASLDGSAGGPAFAFGSETTLGFWRSAAATVSLQGAFIASGPINGSLLKTGGSNTILLGPANGLLNVTNNANTIGSQLKVDALPTIASGFGTGAAIIAGSTPLAGAINVGTTPGTGGAINFGGTAFPSNPFMLCSSKTVPRYFRVSCNTTGATIASDAGLADNEQISWICIGAK